MSTNDPEDYWAPIRKIVALFTADVAVSQTTSTLVLHLYLPAHIAVGEWQARQYKLRPELKVYKPESKFQTYFEPV